MNGSLKIGTAFGIPVRVHWTFLVLLYLFAGIYETPLMGILFAVGLFACVLLHELGHSLVAKSFGIRVIDITFWPLGGMARMTEIPESPKIEGLVAIAGPLVNFGLAAIGAAGMALFGIAGMDGAAQASFVFMGINLLMGTFNLIPAFPMDGGRILRAWLGRTADWVTATEQAVAVGRVFAGIMFVGSLFLMMAQFSFCALPLIAIFVWIAGGRELMAVRMRHGFSPFGRGIRTSVFETPFQEAGGPARTEHEPEPGDARRPSHWEGGQQTGFSDDTVRELERFRGRLRRDSEE